ncbi:hypothetical protein NLJ89_g7257 [Agrocybe chaxingu]|uniref:Uncharacterized protein n=1 Tax=Agrocybe chaxingu TaxID=84603 RepID=A0A9W8K3Z1_9AGAR|nr:hypothetical protein NLJ89_g7257 [Agrocybe chaxingu]
MKSDEEDQCPETVDNYDPEDIWLEHADNAYRLYRKLWTEFYDWEADDCQQTISGLKRYFPRGPLPFDSPGEYPRQPTEDSEWYILEDWNPHTGMLFEATVHSDPIISHKSAPHPRYSTCNSISRNVQSSPDFLLTSSFLPFADDPKFDAEKCLRMFDSLAWQTELQDPDSQ